MCFSRQCCTHCLCPTLWSLCPKTGSVLAMQPLCRSHGWTVVNHYCTQNWGLTMRFLRQCCTHSLCPTLWSQCPKTGSVLAMQPLCRNHDWCGKSLLHTKLWSHHVFFAAMLHSQFVPHIVATVPQNWLGLGHAAFVQKSWLDCGKSLLHTKLGSHHVFFAAMLHSQFVPHIVVTMPQNWLGLGHAAFVQKSCWTVVNHYCTQNWGLTMRFLRQCCTHSLCPTLWSQCPKTGSVLAMQPLCRSHGWTVVNHYCTQNWGLTMCFSRQCCTHCLCPTLWSLCPKTGSVLAMQPLCRSHGWTVVNHYCTQNWGLTMCFLRQCCTHSLCPTLWPLCPKTGSVLAMQPLCRSHRWTVVNHYYTQKLGSHRVFFCGNAALTVCAPHCGHNAPKLARSWPCSLCAEVIVGLW